MDFRRAPVQSTNVKRRTLLLSAAALAAGRSLVACGSGGSTAAGQDQSNEWAVTAVLYTSDPTFVSDLSWSLPPGVKRGGTFAVDPSGTPLPAGVTLAPDGKLSMAAGTPQSSTQGVVFAYTEPA